MGIVFLCKCGKTFKEPSCGKEEEEEEVQEEDASSRGAVADGASKAAARARMHVFTFNKQCATCTLLLLRQIC